MPEEEKTGEEPEEKQPESGEAAREDAGIHVDEDWKAQAAREKEELRHREEDKVATRREEARDRSIPPADFNSLVASFATQALIQLGLVESPATGKAEADLAGAKYTIDLLDMLKQKTKGNLSPEEQRQLDAILYDLKMRFVQVRRQPPGAAPSEPATKPQG